MKSTISVHRELVVVLVSEFVPDGVFLVPVEEQSLKRFVITLHASLMSIVTYNAVLIAYDVDTFQYVVSQLVVQFFCAFVTCGTVETATGVSGVVAGETIEYLRRMFLKKVSEKWVGSTW